MVTPPAQKRPRLTPVQTVCLAVATTVLIGFALIVTGIAMMFGAGWALVTAGTLLCAAAITGGAALLADPHKEQP